MTHSGPTNHRMQNISCKRSLLFSTHILKTANVPFRKPRKCSKEFSRRIFRFRNCIGTMKLFINYITLMDICSLYVISGSLVNENSYCRCLGCAAVWSCKWLPTFYSTLKAVCSSKTLELSARLHGVTSQRTVVILRM